MCSSDLLEKVFAEIDWMGKNRIDYVYIADANFGILYERDKAIVEYFIETKKKYGFPSSLKLTWNKNSTEKVVELTLMLGKVGLNRGMSLSLQSLNDQTLEVIERKNMEISKAEQIFEICNINNLSYYSEFILPLPYETFETWADGMCLALEYGCHGNIEINLLQLIKNAKLTKQVEEHGFVIFRQDMIEKNQNSQIPERRESVIATKYMPKEDFLDSWMYSWIIINGHSHGWTQVIAKAARRFLNKSYREIYDNLWEYVKKIGRAHV